MSSMLRVDSSKLRTPRSHSTTSLERAAAQQVRPGGFDPAGDFIQIFHVLDRAWPGDQAQMPAADLGRPDLHDRVSFVELAAGELERLQDAQHLLDAGQRVECLLG